MILVSLIRVNIDLDGRQAIHEVWIHGHETFLKCLIGHVADLNILDSKQRTPIMICIEFGKWECLKILLTRGALYSMNIKKMGRNQGELSWYSRTGICSSFGDTLGKKKIYYFLLFLLSQSKIMLPLGLFRELVSFINYLLKSNIDLQIIDRY